MFRRCYFYFYKHILVISLSAQLSQHPPDHLHEIRRICRTSAIDERSEVIFGTLKVRWGGN